MCLLECRSPAPKEAALLPRRRLCFGGAWNPLPAAPVALQVRPASRLWPSQDQMGQEKKFFAGFASLGPSACGDCQLVSCSCSHQRGFHAGVRVVGRRDRELWEGLMTLWPEPDPVWGPLLPGAPSLGAERAGLKQASFHHRACVLLQEQRRPGERRACRAAARCAQAASAGG